MERYALNLLESQEEGWVKEQLDAAQVGLYSHFIIYFSGREKGKKEKKINNGKNKVRGKKKIN